MATTPAATAAHLRTIAAAIADALDSAEAPVHVYLAITAAEHDADQSSRVATVDAIAARLGVSAAPVPDGDYWTYEVTHHRDGVGVRVRTDLDNTAQRCGCGARCPHTTPSPIGVTA